MTNRCEEHFGEEQEMLDLDDALAWDPMRLVPPDPWVGHIPFAFWLIKALRPRNLVELGTHSGNSYFAFCQAVARFCPGARSFAVDTWQGDAHAGHYGDEIFTDVDCFNRAHFAQFSTLLRTTFDDARGYFPDGETDLLHIDGLHSYDAVKHDFDNWKGAVSPRGVVLFHDTNVRERGFGVWRLWKELSETYPSFEFGHSHGLGVLGFGADQAPLLRRLFEIGGAAEAAATIRQRVARRGESLQRQVTLLTQRGELDGLRRQVTVAHAEIESAKAHIDELTRTFSAERAAEQAEADQRFDHARQTYLDEIHGRDALIAERSLVIDTKDELIRTFETMAAVQSASVEARDAIIHARDHEIMRLQADMRAQAEGCEAQIATLVAEAAQSVALLQAQLDATVQAYITSTSWKVTRPLRVAKRLVRRGRHAGGDGGDVRTTARRP